MAAEPRQFGPYHLLRRLGVGGMAETFEATRAGTGGFEQRVCLKRVLPAFTDDSEFVDRFGREANLAAQLRHTNIVGVVDVGRIDGVQYMTLELVDGIDLRSLLKSTAGEKLPPEWVTLIAIDLAHALEHAHRTLIHRDISPSNILLSRSGEAKLADFGIAKAIENAGATASRTAKGKVPYMCPEHLRGEVVDARGDLFSLGVVLFEAAAGVRPFDGVHDVETMQKILDGARLTLERAAPEVPKPLREIIERTIEIDPAARPGSAAALIEDLAEVAPPPAARRALAATIEAHRGGPEARLHVRERERDRDTDLSPASALSAPGRPLATRSPARRSRRAIWISALALTAACVASAAIWLGAGSVMPSATEATALQNPSPGEPSKKPLPAPVDVVPAQGATPAATTAPAKRTIPPRSKKGWLHVVVQPWGNVWIDDVWMGRAPVEARVSKGRHVVKVGRELPTETRVVRVEAGARKEVELSLTE